MKMNKVVLMALVASLVLSGCGADKKTETPAPSQPAAAEKAPAVGAETAAAIEAAEGTGTEWAARLGDAVVTPGLYRLNIMSGINEVGAKLNLMSLDDVLTAELDGKTGREYVEDFARQETRRQLAVHKAFTDRGLTLSDEEVQVYQEYAGQIYSGMEELYQMLGVSRADMELLNLYSIENYALFSNLYGEGGELEASAEERREFFEQDSNLARVLLFYKFDPNTYVPYDEDALKAEQEKAQAYLERAQGGESFTHLQWERTNELLKEMGQEPLETESEDLETYNMSVPKVYDGNYPESLVDYLNAAENGTIDKVEDDYFIMIVEKQDIASASDAYVSAYYNNFLLVLKQDEFYAKTLEWAEQDGSSVVYNEEAAANLTPEMVIQATKDYSEKLAQQAAEQQPAEQQPANP